MEGVAILHETLHEIKRKNYSGIILKLDFEKAYDKVNWEFLQQTLRIKIWWLRLMFAWFAPDMFPNKKIKKINIDSICIAF